MCDIINFYLTKANYWPIRRSTKVHGLHTLVLLRLFISNTRFFQLEYNLQLLDQSRTDGTTRTISPIEGMTTQTVD